MELVLRNPIQQPLLDTLKLLGQTLELQKVSCAHIAGNFLSNSSITLSAIREAPTHRLLSQICRIQEGVRSALACA